MSFQVTNMSCVPYSPQVGLFFTTFSYGIVPTSGVWSFRYDRTQGGFDIYQLKESGVLKDELYLPTGGTVRWIFFENNKFLTVRYSTVFVGVHSFRIFMYDLRSGVNRYEVGHGPYEASGTPSLNFHPSQDGTAFFIFFGIDQYKTTTHRIIRTENGDLLCSLGDLNLTELVQRLAEATTDEVRILTSPGPGGPVVRARGDLPRGELSIYPNPQTFPDAVVGGDPSLASTKRTYTLKNIGDDCLTVNSIAPNPPFTVTSTSKTLPADLLPMDTMTVEVTFSPTSTGPHGPTNLTITRNPDRGDSEIVCQGHARSPNYSASVNPTAHNFGTIPINTSSPPLWITITNTSEAPLQISLTAPSAGSPFSWTPFNEQVPYGGFKTFSVTFSPTAVRSYSETLSIQSNQLPNPLAITLNGEGRQPIKSITFNSVSFIFSTIPVGTTSTPQNLTIINNGEVSMNVSLAAPPQGSPFSWSAFNQQIQVGGNKTVPITFTAASEGESTETMSVVSEAPTSPDPISLNGYGCVPKAKIEPPPVAPINFGQIQQGFRTIRYITIKNTGDGILTFTARISGQDSPLYGLQPSTGSVMDVLPIRNYSVNPPTACGPIITGAGETLVAIAFYANDTPRLTNAELIIENHNDTTPTTPPSWTYPLNAEIIAPVTVDAALVLDRSGSMSQIVGTRAKSEAAIEGGQLFAQLIRPDTEDRLTIVKYNELPDLIQQIIEITTANQASIVNKINSTSLAPQGFTSITAGIMTGLDQLAVPRATPPTNLNKIMVVLTDGKDNRAYQNPSDGLWYSIAGGQIQEPSGGLVTSVALPMPPDTKLYGIGLGKEENIDRARLNQLSMTTGAYFGVVGDLDGQSYFDLEKYYTQIYMDVVGTSPVLDPVYTINPGQEHSVEFDVLKGDQSILVVVYDYKGGRLPFHLVSPAGELVEWSVVPQGFQLRSGATQTSRFVELVTPSGEPDRYAGRWTVVVSHTGEVYYGIPGRANPDVVTHRQQLHRRWGFVSNKPEKFDEPMKYGVSIGVMSNLQTQPSVSPGIIRAGEAIQLSTSISEAGIPVKDCWVNVDVVSPSGREFKVNLKDDGVHNDGLPNDGVYGGEFTQTDEAGFYEFKFRIDGKSLDGEPFSRESSRAKYIEGHIPVEPYKGPTITELMRCCNRLMWILRLSSGLLVLAVILLLVILLRGL